MKEACSDVSIDADGLFEVLHEPRAGQEAPGNVALHRRDEPLVDGFLTAQLLVDLLGLVDWASLVEYANEH